jgi:hypothetical protein
MNAKIQTFPGGPAGIQWTAVENRLHGDRFIHKVINSIAPPRNFPFAARGMEQEPTLRFNFFD